MSGKKSVKKSQPKVRVSNPKRATLPTVLKIYLSNSIDLSRLKKNDDGNYVDIKGNEFQLNTDYNESNIALFVIYTETDKDYSKYLDEYNNMKTLLNIDKFGILLKHDGVDFDKEKQKVSDIFKKEYITSDNNIDISGFIKAKVGKL